MVYVPDKDFRRVVQGAYRDLLVTKMIKVHRTDAM